MAGGDAVITSEVAGTTRDVIEVRMDIGGLPVTLLDTAGLRETTDTVESIGVDRAISRAERADLRVFLNDKTDTAMFGMNVGPNEILVKTKSDLEGSTGG